MGSFLGGSKPSVTTNDRSKLDPTQVGLEQVLAKILQGGMPNFGAASYGGQYAAPLSGLENMSLAALEQSALPGATAATNASANTSQQANQAFQGILQGGPQDFENYYQTNVAQPLMKDFTQNVVPAAQAGLGRSAGGFYGSGSDRVTNQITQNLTDSLVKGRSDLAFNTEQAFRNQILQAMQIGNSGLSQGVNDMSNILNAGAVPRGVNQLGMDKAYTEFVRQQGQTDARTNQLMQYLGIPTMQQDTVAQSGTTGAGPGIASSAASAAMMAGMMLMFSSRGMKEKTGEVNRGKVLDAIRALPVERWRYKPGVADGGAQEHIGTYAEEFAKLLGGDGKTISIPSAIGASYSAIQEMADRLEALERKSKKRRAA